MRSNSLIVKFLFRPIYRAFFERPLWWFLAKVKTFFFAETMEQLRTLESRLQKLEALEHRLQHLQMDSTDRWPAIEELLLALFRQPPPKHTQELAGREANELQYYSRFTELTAVNEQNSLR